MRLKRRKKGEIVVAEGNAHLPVRGENKELFGRTWESDFPFLENITDACQDVTLAKIIP